MKRYLVFIFREYYPSGGWNDLDKDFDTMEEVRDYLLAKVKELGPQVTEYTRFHVVDIKSGVIVWPGL